jgi:hypothetical protein
MDSVLFWSSLIVSYGVMLCGFALRVAAWITGRLVDLIYNLKVVVEPEYRQGRRRKKRRDIAFMPNVDRSRVPTSCPDPAFAGSSHSKRSDPGVRLRSPGRLMNTLCDRCQINSSPVASHPARRYPKPQTPNPASRTPRRKRRTVDGHVLQLGDSQVGDDGSSDEGSQGSGEL